MACHKRNEKRKKNPKKKKGDWGPLRKREEKVGYRPPEWGQEGRAAWNFRGRRNFKSVEKSLTYHYELWRTSPENKKEASCATPRPPGSEASGGSEISNGRLKLGR